MKPIKMSPIYKNYIWGGNSLKTIYGKNTPMPPVAESWEISAHPDGESLATGEYSGMSVAELCDTYGKKFYGDSMKDGEDFPLLLKILDAKERLSVQVHPDDAFAKTQGSGEKGKTEAWYILHAEEGAGIIYGFKKDITNGEFRKAIENETLEDILNFVECKAGDVIYIPSGTVHAVGSGLVIAEIQQSSNTTYRVYDYNRRDKEGNTRELHIEKALAVSCLESLSGREKVVPTVEEIDGCTVKKYIDNEFFTFDEIHVVGEFPSQTNNAVQLIFVKEGSLSIDGVEFNKGESGLIPAACGEYKITGNGEILRFWK